jgi:hypothetical protein
MLCVAEVVTLWSVVPRGMLRWKNKVPRLRLREEWPDALRSRSGNTLQRGALDLCKRILRLHSCISPTSGYAVLI